MQRVGNLYPAFCSWENLLLAWRKARRGARRNRESLFFFHQLEPELIRLQEELAQQTWNPQPYRYFEIYDPKQRTISVATFRDRVVHHALINVLEPVYERRFDFDSYATRKGKGVHAAAARAQFFLRRNGWFFKSDIEKYFDSIDHEILLKSLARTIKDRPLLDLTEKIIRNGGANGRGLPIGNLTSQFLANVYLDPFDRFIRETCGQRHYVRYMDDFVVFNRDKDDLKRLRPAIEGFLSEKLRLDLKPSATYFNGSREGLSFLGLRIFPALIRLRSENLRRITGRLRRRELEYRTGDIDEAAFLCSMSSYWAILSCFPVAPLRFALLAHSLRD